MDSLRLEKMYRGWRTDLTKEFSLIAAGMSRFASFSKDADFTGRTALLAERESGPAYRLMGLEIDADDADAISAEPVFSHDGEMIGQTTSGGFGHYTGKSLALAYIESEHAKEGASVFVDLLGERRPALLFSQPPYDPENERLKQ